LPASANWPAVGDSAGGAVIVPDDGGVVAAEFDGEEETGVTGVAGAGVTVLQTGISKLTMKTAATIAIVLQCFIQSPLPSVFTGSGE